MKLQKTVKEFLTLISLLLVCTSSAIAEEQVQNQKGVINELKNNCNTLCFYGEALLSAASYEINHYTDINKDEDNVTTQDDLDFWESFQAQYPFSESLVYINADNISGSFYNCIPEGTTEITVLDNSGNSLDSYVVIKNKNGFTIQKTTLDNPDQSYTITLNKLQELDEIYSNMEEFQATKTYIIDQIKIQA